MSFKLLTITYLYNEYLHSYYQQNPSIKNKTYNEQYELLLNDSSEPVGAYTKMFNQLGIDASCIITNAHFLQNTWKLENNIKSNDIRKIVSEQIRKIKPDVIWIDNVEFLDKSWLDNIKKITNSIQIIFASHCSPFSNKNLEQFRNLKFILTCTPGLYNSFKNEGLKSFLVYHAFNPKILDRLNNNDRIETENNFIFSGSLLLGGGFHSKRTEFIEKLLENNIDLKIYGNLESPLKIKAKQAAYQLIKTMTSIKMGNQIKKLPIIKNYTTFGDHPILNYSKKLIKSTQPPVFGNDMFRLLSNSKIALNIHVNIAGNYAGNVRLFEATGVGTCLLTDNKKNMQDLFVSGQEVVTYDNIEDCIEKVSWLLSNEKERKAIAIAGQKRTLSAHTIENRCKLIQTIITKELTKKGSL